MNWDAIGAVAELLASIGVIISLIYVAVQLRVNGRLTSFANFQHNMSYVSDAAGSIADDSELADIYLRGTQAYEKLDNVEKIRFHMVMTKFILAMEMNFEAKKCGLIEEQLFSDQYASMQKMFKSDGVKQWWDGAATWFHGDTVQQINDIIRNETQ